MKKLLIILLFSAIGLGTIILTGESGMSYSDGTVTINAEEVTINNSEDIKEYLIGLKP